MVFNGKYTFQSTNPTGPRKFLSTVSNDSLGLTFPMMTADVVTKTERVITYQDADGNLIIQTGNLFYFSAEEALGVISSDLSLDHAFPMRVVAAGDGQAAMQVFLADQDRWFPVRYSVNVDLPFLVFPIPGARRKAAEVVSFFNFAIQEITPALSQLQSSRNGRGFDFQDVDFTGSDLSDIDFTGADFTNSILTGVNFSGSTLSAANFIGASLDQANMSGAILDGAVFNGVNLSTVIWGVGMSCQGTDFTNCTAVGCQIGSPDQQTRANFSQAKFTGADFTKADFSNALLNESTMSGGTFVEANFDSVDFTSAELGGVSGTKAADLSFAFMPNVNFNLANLFGVSFVAATLFGALTSMDSTATTEQADFSDAYMEGISMKGATLKGTKFDNACLVNVDFTGADLSAASQGAIAASLTGTLLQGAIFSQATLDAADFAGATISFSEGTVNVRHCDPRVGGPSPPPPDFEPLNHRETIGLDLTTMTEDTVCPNGNTVSTNQQLGKTLQEMLTIANPLTEWVPAGCGPSRVVGPRTDCHPAVIETPNFRLFSFSLRHFRSLRLLADDPDARKCFFWNQQMPDERLKAMIRYYRKQERETGITFWPAYRRSDHRFIGIFGFAQDTQIGGIEMSVAVMPEFRGNPIVKEVYRAVLEHGFSRLALDRIYGMIAAENVPAQKFALKIGFRFLRDVCGQTTIPYKLYEISKADIVEQSSKALVVG